jgi:hypothetical protein
MEEQHTDIKGLMISSRRQEVLYYLSFILWPFGILLAALKHWKQAWTKNVFWIFCIYFGYTFIIGPEGPDSVESVWDANLLVYYARSDMSLTELWGSIYSESSEFVDIFLPLIIYLTSRLTENPLPATGGRPCLRTDHRDEPE